MMMRLSLITIALGGCLHDPTVEVDTDSIELPRGASSEVTISIDGEQVADLSGVYWTVDDPALVSVTPSYDGRHLRIGGNLEGSTVVQVSSYGQILEIPTRVGPPAILDVWTEPANVSTSVGGSVAVRAKALDTLARVVDITFDSRWTVRDQSIASLDAAGMMVHAMGEGTTTLHMTHGADSRVVPISVFK